MIDNEINITLKDFMDKYLMFYRGRFRVIGAKTGKKLGRGFMSTDKVAKLYGCEDVFYIKPIIEMDRGDVVSILEISISGK